MSRLKCRSNTSKKRTGRSEEGLKGFMYNRFQGNNVLKISKREKEIVHRIESKYFISMGVSEGCNREHWGVVTLEEIICENVPQM